MRRLALLAAVACVLAPLAAAAGPAATATAARPTDPAGASVPATGGPPDDGAANPCVGTMTEPAEGLTVVSVQGMRFGDDGGKRQARVVAFGPRGGIEWVHSRAGVSWSYDVDPVGDDELFVTATADVDDDGDGDTVFYKLDARTGDVVWEETAEFLDTHDADLLDDERILVANMRATANVSGNRDRLLVYDRTTDEVTWQWQFRDHFEEPAGGDYDEDWTHVNDVDAVNDTHYLASPRNFDTVVLVNRSSGEVAWTLGEPGDRDVLYEQHNPAYYESENGTPTVLVADSENDRVVEYARRNGSWTRTWRVGNASSMEWPRDADRLPDGNTLVADSANDRVVEVTPEGEVVWEVYAPWLVYDVERMALGDEPDGPTIADENAPGAVDLHGDARLNRTEREPCAAAIANATRLAALGDDGGDGETATAPPVGEVDDVHDDGWDLSQFERGLELLALALAVGLVGLVGAAILLFRRYRQFDVPGED